MSSMDVPARQSYVMAPLPADALLDYSLFGWPLILGGARKLVYDALLLAQFRLVTSPDEQQANCCRTRLLAGQGAFDGISGRNSGFPAS
jgi:hypothetical protein